jgi:hypothetical protein
MHDEIWQPHEFDKVSQLRIQWPKTLSRLQQKKNVHPKSKSERNAFAPKTQLKLHTILSLSNFEVFTSNDATHKHLN